MKRLIFLEDHSGCHVVNYVDTGRLVVGDQ